ncbi:TonB-dependent receptor, partial [Ideonella sp.]|uniref:TonB-dependent receptor n=1 Tax=Ideonella sp. TaxID=1929293 RepID=UPI003BB79A8F
MKSSLNLALLWPTLSLAQPAPPVALPAVEVIGVSPLPGSGIDRALLPYTTLVLRRGALDAAQADHTTDLLARRVPGVLVNDIQGSPYQADLTYRGHRASAMLGASQGLSVYLDGVRINEPFGDVVNWDLIPEFAVQSISLVPGANPAFGLNTLGGALAFTTASGLSQTGGRAELTLGQNGRVRLDLSHGLRDESGWHFYVGGSGFAEDGWRDHSAGDLGQALVKLGRSQGDTAWHSSLLLARSNLVGNGLTPAWTLEEGIDGEVERTPDLYATRRAAVYSHPDRSRNQLAQWQFNLQHSLTPTAELSGLIYARFTQRDTVNGDAAEEIDPSEPDLNAAWNRSAARQSASGLAAALSRHDGAHQWQAGLTLDAAQVRFKQLEQAGRFTLDRGVQAGDEPAELSAAVQGSSWNLGAFVTDTWRWAEATHLTATLRANQAQVSNTLTTVDDDTGVQTTQPREQFSYRSLNPALGITQGLGSGLTGFANLARNTRVPTVIELGCADPDQPCRLPAGLQSDPYLKQVRSTSTELGLRWQATGARPQHVELTAWRTDNRDDIVFGSVSATSQLGYFRNLARTRHQGWDLAWDGHWGPVTVQASYSRLDATYQARDTLRMGERNILVRPGMAMAGLPRHSLKLEADWQWNPAWRMGADLQALSKRGVLGNEDGRIEDVGT